MFSLDDCSNWIVSVTICGDKQGIWHRVLRPLISLQQLPLHHHDDEELLQSMKQRKWRWQD